MGVTQAQVSLVYEAEFLASSCARIFHIGILIVERASHLDVRHAVLLADGFELGLALLVRQHGEGRPHVMLDLVVEPPVHEVVQVAARAVIRRGDHLANEIWTKTSRTTRRRSRRSIKSNRK